MTETDRFPERTQTPTWIGSIALLATVSAFALVGGIQGGVAATALVPIWLLLPGIYVVAFGHILLAAFVGDLSVVSVLAVEIGLLLLLADAAYAHHRPGTLFANAVFAAGGLVVVVAVILAGDGRLWITAGGLLFAFGAAAYGIHRYELVSLGVLTDE
ncbi:hypothetical protein [Natronorarus salvus]|uniref:hypothetical protein n=1 Tax=Natronorarus salvus TaxID=3117733 RepID=UPI002F26508E